MDVKNNARIKKIEIEVSYSEAHFLAEALSYYQFAMQKENGINSEEEKYIGELLHAIRNPKNV